MTAAAQPNTCTVEGEFLGLALGVCGDPITHEVSFTCDGGCVREPRQVCEFHAQLLSEDDESAWCGVCGNHRIHPTGTRLLNGGEPR